MGGHLVVQGLALLRNPCGDVPSHRFPHAVERGLAEALAGDWWRNRPWKRRDAWLPEALGAFYRNRFMEHAYDDKVNATWRRHVALEMEQALRRAQVPLQGSADPGRKEVGAQLLEALAHRVGKAVLLQAALRGLLTEALRLRYEDVSAPELAKAKTIIQSETIYQQETVQGVARKLGYFELVAGGAEFEERYFERVRRVTAADVRAVAERYLTPRSFSVSALTPLAQEGVLDVEAARTIASEVVDALDAQYQRTSFEPGALGATKVALDNGAQLIVLPDTSVPLVSIRSASVGGLLAESTATNGATYLMAELMVRGTAQYPYAQIIEEVDAMAGSLSGIAGRNSVGLRGDFLSESWSRGFELYASCLLEPVFPEAELVKERQTQLEDIAARQDSPTTVAFDRMLEGLYEAHPYRMPAIGTEASVRDLDRDVLLHQYRNQMCPSALTLCVVGDVDVAATVDMVQRRIGSVAGPADAVGIDRPKAPIRLERSSTVFTARDKAQAQLVLGFAGYTLYDERHYALDLLSTVLGGQSGRLFMELRDKRSLAYSVGAYGLEGLDAGYFAAYIGTAPDKLEDAEAGIRGELERVLEAPVTADELARAQRYLIGTHEISLQRASARCGTMALNAAYGLGYDAHAHYAERITAVSPEDILAVARDVIRFDACVRSVVGPDDLRARVEALGA